MVGWMPVSGDGYLKRLGGVFTLETPGGSYSPPIPQTDVTNLVSDLAGKLGVGLAELLTNKNAVSGYAGLDASSKLTGSQQVYGSGSNTACQGNDARLSDARTPLAHTHPASDIVSGTIATARLGSGTADSTTFLRGDQTYAAPAGGGANPEFIWQAQTTAAGITKTNINTTYIGLMGASGTNAAQCLANLSTFNRVEIAYRFNPNETGTYGIKIRNLTDASDLVAALEFSAATGAQDRIEAVSTIAPPSSIKRYEVQVRGPTSTADPIYYAVSLRFHKV